MTTWHAQFEWFPIPVERPEYKPTKKITDMKVGETGWTTPWSLVIDQQSREAYLSKYTTEISENPRGSAKLMVVKTLEGLSVYLPKGFSTYFIESLSQAHKDWLILVSDVFAGDHRY